MEKCLLIGLNPISVDVAKRLQAADVDVTVVDRIGCHTLPVDPDVKLTLLAERDLLLFWEGVAGEQYNAVILVMTKDMEFPLACLVQLSKRKFEKVLVCVENEKQEKLVELFGHYETVRVDREMGRLLSEKLIKGSLFNL